MKEGILVTANTRFENEDQFMSYMDENYGLSPGRYSIIKSVCEYLEMDGLIDESEFSGVKLIFGSYITNRISALGEEGINPGSLTGLQSKGIIDSKNQLTEKGFEVIRIVSYHLTYL